MIFGAQWPVQRFTKGTAMLSPLQLHFLILGQSKIWIEEAFDDTALRGWGPAVRMVNVGDTGERVYMVVHFKGVSQCITM